MRLNLLFRFALDLERLNLRYGCSNKNSELQKYLENSRVVIYYLPPYSPDLNPIEHVWANLKRFIRTNDNRQDNLSLAIEQSIDQLFMC